MSRELIYQRLFALGAGLTWAGGGSFLYTKRRVMTFANLPAQPALCQAEPDETISGSTGMPNKNVLGAAWFIYHQAGADPAAIPATTSNAILDAIDLAFPSDPDVAPQTLGGLVHKAVIAGRVMKEHGDLEGQALLIVPIKILIP
jgi:hypothetical protein